MISSKLKFPAIQNHGIYVFHNTIYIHRIIKTIPQIYYTLNTYSKPDSCALNRMVAT